APCEAECSRGDVDAPIAIRSVKRFLADWAAEHLPPVEPAEVRFDERVAIVGAGPSGMTAARDLALLGYRTTVYEARSEAGGMLRFGIPEYRLPRAALQQDIERVLALGVELRVNQAAGRDFTVDSLFSDGYGAVYLAVGLQAGRPLPISGNEAGGVLTAVDLLGEATLEPVEVGKRVVVIGGGDVAYDAGRTALRLGADDVTLVCIEDEASVPASDEERREGADEGIALVCSRMPTEIRTDADGRACAVVFTDCTLGEVDGRGWRPPVPVEGTPTELACDTVVFATGQGLVEDFIAGLEGVRIERSQIVADPETQATDRAGVFAGGDAAATGPWTSIEAVAAGRRAARSIHNYLRGEHVLDVWDRRKREARPDDAALAATRVEPREDVPHRDGEARRRTWDEVSAGFTAEQAVAEARRCLNCAVCSECFECVRACGPGAFLHDEEDRELELEVGAVVLAPGFDVHDPGTRGEYGYGRYPNVLSALEYERMLSASGPTQGQIGRPSDGRHPRSVAFIQCVGSRDQEHGYCSSVCCMFANKQAMLTLDHEPECEATVFLMDMRAMGKGADAFFRRARDMGVRFVRSRPSSIREDPRTGDPIITWEDAAGALHTDRFDLVVLSVGVEPSRGARATAGALGIALERHGFCELQEYEPLDTSRPGVFVAGPFGEPKDIPDSVAEASAAAARVMAELADSRGTLTAETRYPPERPVEDEDPRVGVFVCHCGSNIASVIDVEDAADYARGLRGVVCARDTMYACSSDSLALIKEQVREHGLNRVVVASCTPRTHEPIFQDTLREAGLNPFLFEMANIRDQASWVHRDEPERATAKAKDLIRMSVARARELEPLPMSDVPITHAAVVVGGGVAGMTSAVALGEMGHQVHLVERTGRLGGYALQLDRTIDGGDPVALAAELARRVTANPNVTVHLRSELTGVHGFVGNFSSVIEDDHGDRTTVEHGVVIVATGAREGRPEVFGLGASPRIVTGMDLERMLAERGPMLRDAGAVGFLLCAGSLDEGIPYCSQTCCGQSIKNAIRLKEQDPDRPVYVWFKEIRTAGLAEEHYTRAREMGVVFTRYEDGDPPAVSEDGSLRVEFLDPSLHRRIRVALDLLVLATPTVPNEGSADLAKMLRVPVTPDGFFLEAHVKLRPVDFASEGIFLCGSAHHPKDIGRSISQAYAAAGRAAAILAKPALEAGGVVAEVDQERCAACLTCVRICPYGVPVIDPATKKATIEAAACQGCGICAGECPAKAIELHHYTDAQILAKEEALTMELV
ncbi:MAG TPA: FAD-dependent oxidoreductase, partial [Actinomycetota bacterium]|nr:FAD-dependent oxidoreductase [Actinomycetota bacterium]